MTGLWQSGVGLPPIAVGAMRAASMTPAPPDMPYALVAGTLAPGATGVVLALMWVAFFPPHMPVHWILQGVAYGIMTALAAAVIVVPLAAGVGIFFSNTPAPVLMHLSGTVIHLAYGLSLTFSLKVAGVARQRAARGAPLTAMDEEGRG